MKKEAAGHAAPKLSAAWLVYPLLVVLLAGGYGYLWRQDVRAQEAIQQLQTYIGSSEVVQALNTVESLNAGITAYRQKLQEVQAAAGRLTNTPLLAPQLLEQLFRTAGEAVTITGVRFTAADGTVELDCTTLDPRLATAFVESLKQDERLVAVDYTGYTAEKEIYSFSALLTLKTEGEEG